MAAQWVGIVSGSRVFVRVLPPGGIEWDPDQHPGGRQSMNSRQEDGKGAQTFVGILVNRNNFDHLGENLCSNGLHFDFGDLT